MGYGDKWVRNQEEAAKPSMMFPKKKSTTTRKNRTQHLLVGKTRKEIGFFCAALGCRHGKVCKKRMISGGKNKAIKRQ